MAEVEDVAGPAAVVGEHGVGLLKKRWLGLETGPVAAELHQGIKQVFDPLNILNPGKAI